MRGSFLKILIVCLTLVACHSPKQLGRVDSETLGNLQAHIQYLASDKLEGRRTGTNGEKLAMEYISEQFRKEGLLPKGEQGYYQAFEVYDGKQMGKGMSFSINGNPLVAGSDFFPFPFSASQKVESTVSISIQEAGVPWFFDLKETLEENKSNLHFDLPGYIYTNCKKAGERGASSVILYNSSALDDKLSFDPKDRSESLPIPALYLKKETAKKYLSDPTATLDVKFNVILEEKKRTGHNVIGYIDHGAATTIVLGAHFDHLGYGEDGNSRNASGIPEIHNGADDNASGTAALIELGRKLKTGGPVHHNYLLIAFSGEELGLYGSKYFTEHPTIDLGSVDYMINMDMVGRLNDSSHTLTIGGYGTSPAWARVIDKDAVHVATGNTKTAGLDLRIDSSGTGPSDHTSFYRKNIPVLFYFTGLHTDYHKPSDDADKINYGGELRVIDHILYVIRSLDGEPRLTFTKTREVQTGGPSRLKVTLGLMIDYTYAGSGIKVDGVIEGKPGEKAGLRAGDIIVSLAGHATNSMETYMQALNSLDKGDKTTIRFKRGGEILEARVEF